MGPLWAKSARSPKTATNGLTEGGRGGQVMCLAGSKPSPTIYILLASKLLPNLGLHYRQPAVEQARRAAPNAVQRGGCCVCGVPQTA